MKPFIKDNKFTESYNQPRQLFPETFIPNGYVDIVKPKVFFNKKALHGNKMLLWETNTIADIEVLEGILSERGYSGDDINAIMYGNFISFCKKYLP